MHTRDHTKASTVQKPTSSPAAKHETGAVQRRAALRGMSYDEGAAALAPLQLKEADAPRDAALAGPGPAESDAAGMDRETDKEDGRDYAADVALIEANFAIYADTAAKRWGWSASQIKSMVGVESQGKKEAGKGHWKKGDENDWVEPKYKGLMQMSLTAWSSVQSAHGTEYLAGGTTAAGDDKLINDYPFAVYTNERVDLESMCFDAYVNIMFGAAYMNIAAGEIQGNLKVKGVKSKADPTVTLKVDTKYPAKALLAYNYGGGGVADLIKRANAAGEDDPTNPKVFTKDDYLEPDVRARFGMFNEEQVKKKMTEVQRYVTETEIYQGLFDAKKKEQEGEGGTGTTTTGGNGTTTKVGTGTTTKVGTGTTGETGLRYRLQVASHPTNADIVMKPLKDANPGMNFYSRKESSGYKIFVGLEKGYEKKVDASAFTTSGKFKEPWVVTYENGVRQTPPPSTTK